MNKDGNATHISDVKVGDEITAMIVRKVRRWWRRSRKCRRRWPRGAPATAAAPSPAKDLFPGEPDTDRPAPAASAAAAPAMLGTGLRRSAGRPPPAMPVITASAPAEASGMGTTGWILMYILLIAVALYFFSRRRKPQ